MLGICLHSLSLLRRPCAKESSKEHCRQSLDWTLTLSPIHLFIFSWNTQYLVYEVLWVECMSLRRKRTSTSSRVCFLTSFAAQRQHHLSASCDVTVFLSEKHWLLREKMFSMHTVAVIPTLPSRNTIFKHCWYIWRCFSKVILRSIT